MEYLIPQHSKLGTKSRQIRRIVLQTRQRQRQVIRDLCQVELQLPEIQRVQTRLVRQCAQHDGRDGERRDQDNGEPKRRRLLEIGKVTAGEDTCEACRWEVGELGKTGHFGAPVLVLAEIALRLGPAEIVKVCNDAFVVFEKSLGVAVVAGEEKVEGVAGFADQVGGEEGGGRVGHGAAGEEDAVSVDGDDSLVSVLAVLEVFGEVVGPDEADLVVAAEANSSP
jgi:hypothetical protein